MVFVFLDQYDVNTYAEQMVMLRHLSSFGQRSSHFLHLQYGVLNFKLSFNTTSRRRSALLSTPVWNYRNIPYRTEWIEYPDIEFT